MAELLAALAASFTRPGSCPGCSHPWTNSHTDYGCEFGWVFENDGTASVTGCECRIVHLDESRRDDA